MKEDNNIEDLFRSSFDHFEVVPPSSVKGAIDHELGGSPGKRGWWIFGSVLAAVAVASVFFFYYSSAKQDAVSTGNHLASTQTTDDRTASTSTGDPTANSSTNQTTTSSSGEANNNTVSSTNGAAKQDHSTGNQTASSSKNSTSKSVTAGKGNNKKSAAKNSTSKPSKTASQKSKGKKSSGKKPKKNSGTPDFSDLTPPLQLTMFDPDPSKTLNAVDNTPLEGDGKTNASDPKGNGNPDTNPPTNDPKEDPIVEKADSTEKEATKKVMPQPKPRGDNWMASVYAGPSFLMSSKDIDEYHSVTEKPAFQFSAEINRNLVAGYGVTTGFGFNQRKETFSLTGVAVIDSGLVTIDSIPIYGEPNFPDSITGYYDTTFLQFDTIPGTTFSQLNRVQTIGIPLFITKHFSFSDRWGLLVNAGAVFQFYKVSQGELNGMPAPTVNDFGLSLAGRFHATYTWNNWMFSAGVSTGLELKQALIYEGIDRKRYFISPQFGIHLRF